MVLLTCLIQNNGFPKVSLVGRFPQVGFPKVSFIRWVQNVGFPKEISSREPPWPPGHFSLQFFIKNNKEIAPDSSGSSRSNFLLSIIDCDQGWFS